MADYGDYNLSAVVRMKFTTTAFATAAPTTLSGTPVVKVYKVDSTTESAAGVSLTVDFDGMTGLNHVVIDTSADGTFYAAGCDFQAVITAGTVGGTSVVGAVVGSFSIDNRSALRPATAGRTLVVDSAGLADATMVKAGPSGSATAQTARDIGGNVDVATSTRMATFTPLTGAQIATFVWTDTTAGDFTTALSIGKSIMNGVSLGTGLTVNALTTNNDKTGYSLTQGFPSNFSSLGITSTGHIINVDTIFGTSQIFNLAGSVTSVTGAVNSVTNSIGGNVNGSVNTIGATGLAAIENQIWNAATSSHTTAGSYGLYVASISSLSASGLRTALGLASANLDTQLAPLSGASFTTIMTMATRWTGMVELSGSFYRYTTAALANAPTGGSVLPHITKIIRAADGLSVDVHSSSPVEIITFAQGFADQNFQVGMQAPDHATAVTSSVITLFYPDGVGDDAPWELDAQPNWLVTAVQFPDSGIVQAPTGGSGDASEASVQKILRVVQARGDV